MIKLARELVERVRTRIDRNKKKRKAYRQAVDVIVSEIVRNRCWDERLINKKHLLPTRTDALVAKALIEIAKQSGQEIAALPYGRKPCMMLAIGRLEEIGRLEDRFEQRLLFAATPHPHLAYRRSPS